MAKQDESATAALRNLPSVDALLKNAALKNCAAEVGRNVVVDSIRRAIDQVRTLIVSKTTAELDETAIRERIVAGAKQRLDAIAAPHYKRVINATGIILLRRCARFRKNYRGIRCCSRTPERANAPNETRPSSNC